MKLICYKRTLWTLLVTTLIVLWLYIYNFTDFYIYECDIKPDQKLSLPNFENHLSSNIRGECQSVLSHMTRGHWRTRPLTRKENEDIVTFLTNAHVRHQMPTNYERDDGLCGNVTHQGTGTARWFRALCDPKGPTPCCYHNQCVLKSVEECQCENCYDMRHMRHAEYSTWIPSHPACPYKEHSPQEACDILSGASITFVGDSLVRHVYTAFLLVVTGNTEHGAIQIDADQKTRELCRGMYMFTEKKCSSNLRKAVRLCHGSVDLQLLYYYTSWYGQFLRRTALSMGEKSLIFTGIGIHDFFKIKDVQRKFLRPTLTCMLNSKRTWPRLVWAESHAPGILKSPVVLSQTYDSVRQYNTEMEKFLNSWNFPIFKTFNLTNGMMSFDGEHYGIGMNIVKANILLSFLKELRSKEGW